MIQGSLVAIVTPMHDDGAVDEAAERLGLEPLAAVEAAGARLYRNQTVQVSGKPDKKKTPEPLYTHYPTLVEANLLHAEGITGAGVTVAVLDSGWDNFGSISYDTAGEWRVLQSYDAIQDAIVDLPWRGPVYYPPSWGENDVNGHASHLMSIMASKMNTNYYEPTEPGLLPPRGEERREPGRREELFSRRRCHRHQP